jgi:hypothetical protein
MNCKEKKEILPVIRTESCGSLVLVLSQRTQDHMEAWQIKKILRPSDWSIMSCNSTVSTVARETNLGTVVPFER